MSRWPDRFLPPFLGDDPDALRRARLTVVLTLVLVGTAVFYTLLYAFVVRFRDGALVLGGGALAATIPLAVLRRRGALRACGHLLTLVLYATLVALLSREGGLDSLATPWLITPPIFAILMLGRREAVGWSVLCALTVAGVAALESAGWRFPTTYPPAWAARLTFGSHAGLVVCTAILLHVFEGLRADAQARAEEASAELARLAYHDGLTGLANRARFLALLDTALGRAGRAGEPERVAVLMLDLDAFKPVNDGLGHAAGDELLTHVAARLLGATRGSDTVGRLGGDEFAVLLDGVRHDGEVAVVADRVVTAIGEPFRLAAGEARIGVSVGAARGRLAPDADPPVPETAASLLHLADVALYRAKALGRGRWVAFRPAMLAEGGVAPGGCEAAEDAAALEGVRDALVLAAR